MTRQQFDYLCAPDGPLFVGTPQAVADKLIRLHGSFQNTRFIGQLMLEGMPHEAVLRSIELFGQVVSPAVQQALAPQTA
jgi:alkanesulfonate monooxygenase SsuD/methylene tetrahydromethanopterin reductase-like flavin-dependent oxidoreductase (luciferase family)